MLAVTPIGFPFVIHGNELKTTRSLNYEAQQSWQVTVRTTDSGGLSISETFQVAAFFSFLRTLLTNLVVVR